METINAACNAMATRFEMVLHGSTQIALRAAADAAVHEIQRLHAQLSLYSASSEISYINARASRETVQVEPGLFRLLQLAQEIHRETDGAFDITIAPLIRCWGFMGGCGAFPTPEQIAEARAKVGMQYVLLDEARRTVRFARAGVMIDLGSIGKGYALDAARETLLEAGIQNALIHGGTSTVYAIGTPPGFPGWKVAIDRPPQLAPLEKASETEVEVNPQPTRPLAVVDLKDESLSVSAVHGKSFSDGAKRYGHVIDPRTGVPAQRALLAAIVLPSATESDALSTALLIAGLDGQDRIEALRPGMRSLVTEQGGEGGMLKVAGRGIDC